MSLVGAPRKKRTAFRFPDDLAEVPPPKRRFGVTGRRALGAAAAGQVSANRKKFRGTLERAAAGWQIVWSDAPAVKPGQKVSKKKAPAPLQALGFTPDELKEARLASIVDFKGRKPKERG